MQRTNLDYFDQNTKLPRQFRSGISLHSHTLHSKESISVLGRIAGRVALVNWIFQHEYRRHRGKRSLPEDMKRWWWTSPLSATQALATERGHIEQALDLPALVSISDHDDIEAPLQLQLIEKNSEVPVAVEWTAPYYQTYFHIGVHNIPPQTAKSTMERLEAYTVNPEIGALREILSDLHSNPEILLIFNHPAWDQTWVGMPGHFELVKRFILEFKPYLHALEINGLRSWRENREVIDLARDFGVPLISGGDRHGREANAMLNLSHAATFAEFVEEVRGGFSHVLVMPEYRQPLKQRIIQSTWDIVRDDKDHSMGWTHLTDRVFRLCESGEIKSMAHLVDGKEPIWVRQLITWMRLLSSPKVRPALQMAWAGEKELAL